MTDSITHGNYSAYFNGCRCGPCIEAGRQYRRRGTYDRFIAGKTRKQPLFHPNDRTEAYDVTDPRHGSLSAYTMGCRCPWCVEAGRAYRAFRKAGLTMPTDWNSHADGVPGA